MDISIKIRQAYTEIDNFIELLDEEDRNKIPKQLRELFKENKDNNYIKEIDINNPISEQNLKEETLALIALLNLQYWCTDEQEKLRLKKVYSENEKKYQELLQAKYNPNDIFKRKISKVEREQNEVEKGLVEYKKSNFNKFISFIKKLFKSK